MPRPAAGSSTSAATAKSGSRRCSARVWISCCVLSCRHGGLDPAMTVFICRHAMKTWMPGSPGMTNINVGPCLMRRIFFRLTSAVLLVLPCISAHAAEPAPREPYGIGLEGFAYPYPVSLLPLTNDGEQVRMAYMDVTPAQPNGRIVVLLHGRNFPSSYWAPVIRTLTDAGYRVVVPDQIGFGKSSKPSADLHFDTLARNTIAL